MPLEYVTIRGSRLQCILSYISVFPSHTSQIIIRKVGAYMFIRVAETNLTKYCQINMLTTRKPKIFTNNINFMIFFKCVLFYSISSYTVSI